MVIAPSFLWFVVEYHFYAHYPMFSFAKFIGLLVMLLIIPVVFYTYQFFTKKNVLILDILSFVLAVIVGQFVFHIFISFPCSNLFLKHVGIVGLLLVFFIYITHTFVPTKNFLYQDSITHKYGFKGHVDKK